MEHKDRVVRYVTVRNQRFVVRCTAVDEAYVAELSGPSIGSETYLAATSDDAVGRCEVRITELGVGISERTPTWKEELADR